MTEPVHNSSVSSSEGTDPKGKKEGTGNLVTAILKHSLETIFVKFYTKSKIYMPNIFRRRRSGNKEAMLQMLRR